MNPANEYSLWRSPFEGVDRWTVEWRSIYYRKSKFIFIRGSLKFITQFKYENIFVEIREEQINDCFDFFLYYLSSLLYTERYLNKNTRCGDLGGGSRSGGGVIHSLLFHRGRSTNKYVDWIAIRLMCPLPPSIQRQQHRNYTHLTSDQMPTREPRTPLVYNSLRALLIYLLEYNIIKCGWCCACR